MTDPQKRLVVKATTEEALKQLHDAVDTYFTNPSADTYADVRFAQCVAQIALFNHDHKPGKTK